MAHPVPEKLNALFSHEAETLVECPACKTKGVVPDTESHLLFECRHCNGLGWLKASEAAQWRTDNARLNPLPTDHK